MDSSFSSLLIPQQSASSINGDTRRSANFPPNIWGDYFLFNTFHSMEMEDNIEEKVEAVKEEVRKLLITCVEKPSQQLSLIDSIQRLGIAYHFDTEINEALDHVYKNYSVVCNENNEDLQIVAMKFRLLRQQRYSISCDIFDKFTDDEGNFKESLAKDVRGMLSLYEASHVRIHGEDVLERALSFSTTNLKAAISNGSHEGSCGIGGQVRHALKWPVFKAMPRLAARSYISFYEQDPLHHPTLLYLAKLDYNILQKLYQKELHEISRWDDVNCIEGLPKYMKVYYEALMDTYRGIEHDISKDDISYALHYAKEAMKRQARNYFFEAKWYHDGYTPTIEEYLRVGRVTACYNLFSPISFLGMGDVASMEAFEWIESDPKSLIASGVIGRIMNDITSYKFEQDRRHSASAVECYMKQYDVSEKEATRELNNQVTNSWKEIIEDFVQSIDVPNTTFFMSVLNLARLSDTFYKHKDGYTYSDGETKLIVISLLVDPVPI
ncbi:(+)-gamma-cadinene synthase-like [Momordica charantia]|uniref:(+)-gamma-cadinene synthase-like n=1 Tax=Momordica charantia TaxID=3673 RepID=A0A6J1DIG3_MOMCH|nr:(+)-gamma-cadinene synthase-like [Momordica charantia]